MTSRGTVTLRALLFWIGFCCASYLHIANAAETTTIEPDDISQQPLVYFDPPELLIYDNEVAIVNYNVTLSLPQPMSGEFQAGLDNPEDFVTCISLNDDVANVKGHTIHPFSNSMAARSTANPESTTTGNFTVAGEFLGITKVSLVIGGPNKTVVTAEYVVRVRRAPRPIDKIFTIVLTVCIICANFMFGCLFDIPVAKEVLRKPIAPVIGFVCQYTIMPTTSFLVGWLLDMPISLRLGLLAVGCSPGGGSSNIWSLNLNGDVTLSIVMTFISNVCALFMMPLWLLTLGKQIAGDNIHIPFLNILTSLLMFIVPIFIGLGVCRWKPRIKKFVQVIARPYTLVQAVFMLSVGLWSNWYVFKIVEQEIRILIAGMCLPYIGLALGAVVAILFQQSRARVITIGIETAFQNGALALVLLRRTLEVPEGDLASVAAVISAILTPVPLLIAFIILIIKTRCVDRVTKKGLYAPVATDEKGEMNGNDFIPMKDPAAA